MQLYILDASYETIGIIDEAESVLWNKKYNDAGECEVYITCTETYLALLQKGNYIYRFDDDMFCKIEKVQIETDIENGDYIIATAADICKILSGRIVRWTVVYSGTAAGFIERLLVENVINPEQARRRIPNFEIDTSNFSEFTEEIQVSAGTEDLLQLIITTCKAFNYGFRLSYNINSQKLVFRLYRGKNKATTRSEEYVEFSPQYANIISSAYTDDESAYKNVAYVSYKDANEEVVLLSLYNGDVEPQGENRREIFIDGTNLTREVTVEELKSLFGEENVKRYPEVDGEELVGYYYIVVDGEEIQIATFGREKDDTYIEETELEVIDL